MAMKGRPRRGDADVLGLGGQRACGGAITRTLGKRAVQPLGGSVPAALDDDHLVRTRESWAQQTLDAARR